MSFWKPDLLKVDWKEEEKLGEKKKKKRREATSDGMLAKELREQTLA